MFASPQASAEMLDLPLGTVKSRLYYANKALRKRVEEEEE